jgi:hypothetical protein
MCILRLAVPKLWVAIDRVSAVPVVVVLVFLFVIGVGRVTDRVVVCAVDHAVVLE